MGRFRIGDRVLFKGMPMAGSWRILAFLPETWLRLAPEDSAARILANLSPCGTVDIRPRDITRIELTQETLPWSL